MVKKYRSIDDPWGEDAPEEKKPVPIWSGPPYLIEEYKGTFSAPKCPSCGEVYSYGDARYSFMCRCDRREYWKNKAKAVAMFVGITVGIFGLLYLGHRVF